MIGRIIGTYKIVEKLGEGGMGAVYKGVDTMLDREVAIKALKPELASQTAVVERFRSEAVTLAKLNHPNIATLFSLFRQGDELFMVLEYVRGETLDQILSRRGALPTEEVIPVFCQILDGINHAHGYGIIHRDIKPANMILTETGMLKVLDFGIARLLGSNRMTRAGNIIGTLEYMAPEQVKGLETDSRTDTYALGMMLYEVLTGRTPFNTDNEFELMKLQTESLPPLPRSINPSIPESVEAAIMKAIQKDPDDRFQTAGEFREFLLDAGFIERASIRRPTGPNQAFAGTRGPSPISNPEVSTPTGGAAVAYKETRLGTPVEPSNQPHEAKETRLGVAAGEITQGTIGQPQVSSLFERLTWVHIAGAGGVLIVIIGFLIVVPMVIFSDVFSSGNSANSAPANANSSEKDIKKAAIAMPEPTKETVRATPVDPTPAHTLDLPVKLPVNAAPSPEGPSETPPTTKSAKSTPPPPAKPAQPKPAKSTPKGTLNKARCALTGDC